MSGREDAAPVPIVAGLRYDDDQVQRLQSASSRGAKRAALKSVHDELAAHLSPQLERLRSDGLAVDHATSWLLAEVVVHAPRRGAPRRSRPLRPCRSCATCGAAHCELHAGADAWPPMRLVRLTAPAAVRRDDLSER